MRRMRFRLGTRGSLAGGESDLAMPSVVIGESYRVAARVMERALPKRLRERARDWPAVAEYTTAAVPVGPLAALAARRTLDAWAAVGLAQSLTSLALALWLELGELADGLPLGVLCRAEAGRLRALSAAELAGRLMIEVEDFHRLAGLLAAPGVAFLELIEARYTYEEADAALATTAGAPFQFTLFSDQTGAPAVSPVNATRTKSGPQGCDSPAVSSASRGPPRTKSESEREEKRNETKRAEPPRAETGGVAETPNACPPAPVSTLEEDLRDDVSANDRRAASESFMRLTEEACGERFTESDRVTMLRVFDELWESRRDDGHPPVPRERMRRFALVRETIQQIIGDETVRNPAAYFVTVMQRHGLFRRRRESK